MSLKDWAKDARVYFQHKPRRVATRAATQEFWQGITKRVGQYCSGTYVWEKDWDVLCLLDGCRVDVMNEALTDNTHSFLPETGSKLRSVGTMSPEWLGRTFKPEFHDKMARTGYVTGNV